MGQWVLDVRTHVELSQEEFAAKLRVGRTAVADWERGDNYPEGVNVLGMVKMHPTLPLPGQHFTKNDTAESATIAAFIAPLAPSQREQIKNEVREMVKKQIKSVKAAR